ncbi:hypothetical protein GCM10010219_14900 [Streptomyces netropsis]|nr:hypothetical protein GCM10010219_14900 [Streptomyces netropsis]
MSSDSVPGPTNARDSEVINPAPTLPRRQDWPTGAMDPGCRVTVLRDEAWDGPWQQEFSGRIDDLARPGP